MKDKGIDIIVPIFNAYEDLVKCIDSVKRYTDLSVHRLILINDCSADERILPYIRSEETENIIVINNEKNVGFSNNVNRGMLYSNERDVLLLNSDTIVTENWIDKIITCAYSKAEIGTVTPMSNRANLCSYPIMCMDNDIPENWTVDSLAQTIERCSMRMYPRITVAVAFCMYIKRETIERVGFFDAETFGCSYGVEKDFCNRAEQLGYIHVMCDDTFIYHKGTVSFLNEKKKVLSEAHEKIIKERYPAQTQRNSDYCDLGLNQYIRENVHIYTKANPQKKNLMYLVQADFRKDAFDNMGGTQHHVRDLTMKMKDEYNVYVVARDRDYLRVTMYSGEEVVSLKYYIGERERFPRVHDTDLAKLLKNILCAFEINMLHVHHVYGLSFDIFEVAESLKIPIVLTMHDYYYICPNVKLVNADESYCEGYCDDSECTECLKKNAGVYVDRSYLKKWREICSRAFEKCEKLIVPSQAAKDIYVQYYPQFENKIKVIEHGLELSFEREEVNPEKIQVTSVVKSCFDVLFNDENNPYAARGWAYILGVDSNEVSDMLEVTCGNMVDYIPCIKNVRVDIGTISGNENYICSGFSTSIFKEEYLNKELKVRIVLRYKDELLTNNQNYVGVLKERKAIGTYNVAFLGGMVKEKGSQKVYEMIKNGPNEICWHIFGTIIDQDLVELQKDNLIKHGTYSQSDVPQLLKTNDIDVVCIVPIWPETFCYTLSEAVYCNEPVFVTDIGAAGERVKRHGYGWTVPVEYSGIQMADVLLNILRDREEYEKKKALVENFKEITLSDMAKVYKEIYQHYQRNVLDDMVFDTRLIFSGLGIPAGMKNSPYMYKDGSALNKELYKEIKRLENEILAKESDIQTKDAEKESILNSKTYRLGKMISDNFATKIVYSLLRKK